MKSIYIIRMVIMLAVVMLISGCVGGVEEVTPAKEVAQVKDGDVVRVHYTGKTDDGAVFDSSLAQEPLQFTIGEGKLLARFEQAVIGMKPGESKSINIPADEAYGPYREDLVMVLDWSHLTEGVEPEVGPAVNKSSTRWSNYCSHSDRSLRIRRDGGCQSPFSQGKLDL